MGAPGLPRLLYLGDVPVESTYHGSALVYRLLQGYPADRLCVIENAWAPSQPDRRLPGVGYRSLAYGNPRWLNTRFHEWYALGLSLGVQGAARRVREVAGAFGPEAVLTVAHGQLWAAADIFARWRHLPLHLIVHDDWPRVARLPWPFVNRIDRQFGRVYQSAASRGCASPFMVQEYQRRYGAKGQVLYPCRALDALEFEGPPERLRQQWQHGLVFAFAGTINSPGYSRLLRTLADCLAVHQSELLIFGPLTQAEARMNGLDRPNIRLGGLLASNELIGRLRDRADVLYVPMSFEAADSGNMSMGFPSKLTDYTTVGLPLLIQGPASCSAVRWATENPGVAEVVSSDDPGLLAGAIGRIVGDPARRIRLAHAARSIGSRDFSHQTAQMRFFSALTRGDSGRSVNG